LRLPPTLNPESSGAISQQIVASPLVAMKKFSMPLVRSRAVNAGVGAGVGTDVGAAVGAGVGLSEQVVIKGKV